MDTVAVFEAGLAVCSRPFGAITAATIAPLHEHLGACSASRHEAIPAQLSLVGDTSDTPMGPTSSDGRRFLSFRHALGSSSSLPEDPPIVPRHLCHFLRQHGEAVHQCIAIVRSIRRSREAARAAFHNTDTPIPSIGVAVEFAAVTLLSHHAAANPLELAGPLTSVVATATAVFLALKAESQRQRLLEVIEAAGDITPIQSDAVLTCELRMLEASGFAVKSPNWFELSSLLVCAAPAVAAMVHPQKSANRQRLLQASALRALLALQVGRISDDSLQHPLFAVALPLAVGLITRNFALGLTGCDPEQLDALRAAISHAVAVGKHT